MALKLPSLSDLGQRIRSAFRQELPGTDATVWPNTLYVVSKVKALLLFEAYLRLGYLYDQLFASTADMEHLERRHAYEYGITRKPATRATGNLLMTGTPSTAYPAGIRFISGRDSYVSTQTTTANGVDGTLIVPVKAETPGASGNREAEAVLTLVDAALNPTLSREAEVDGQGLGGGADAEAVESLRARILDRKRRLPQGGAESDYERWALEESYVTRAWARRNENGPGSVSVWFLAANGAIPTVAEITSLKTALDAKRLVGLRDLRVYATTAVPVNITIDLSPDSVETRAAVDAQLEELFDTRMRPGLPNDTFIMPVAWISEAISTALGEDRHTLNAPASDQSFTLGQLPTLGTVAYV